MKRFLSLLMTLSLLLTLAACGAPALSDASSQPESSVSSQSEASEPADSQPDESSESSEAADPSESSQPEPDFTPVPTNVVALKGPTAIGMVQLMEGGTEGDYSFQMVTAPNDIVGLITTGAVDIAAVPANLAAVLYNKTQGGVKMAAVNTLGVLYVVERGETVQSVADLAGKTLYATGQGSTPEYALNYILARNEVECDVQYLSEHSELATQLLTGGCDLALLPQPFVTTVMQKDPSLRIALDLTADWNAASEGKSQLVMGALIVRTAFLEEHPEAVDKFLAEYAQSVQFVNSDPAAAAALCEKHDIIPAAVAEKAIPNCNIVCLTGCDMTSASQDFFQVLFDANPAAVGGTLPDGSLYYAD